MRIWRLCSAFRLLSALLAAVILAGSPVVAAADSAVCAGALTDNPNFSPVPVVDARYYTLLVDKHTEILTVLRKDSSGKYTVIDRQFECSTGRANGLTPIGTFRIGKKYRWRASRAPYGEYMQFACRIHGSIMIHSVPYMKQNPNRLSRKDYLALGKPASAGCIRLTTRDAKWIYANCPAGTVIKIVKSGGPAAVCVEPVPKLAANATWDPTDTSISR